MIPRKYSDWIQLGILLISGIGMLGGFWAYCESRFASKESVENVTKISDELKAEVDALYLKLIPQAERSSLKFSHAEGRQ